MIKVIKQYPKSYLVAIISLMLIAIGVATSSMLVLAAFALLAFSIIFFDPGDAYAIMFAIMPFANIFKLAPSSTSLFTVLELLLVFVCMFRLKKISTGIVLSLLLLCCYMVLFSWNNLQILTIVKVLIGFVMIYYATHFIRKEDVINIGFLSSFSVASMLILSKFSGYFRYIEPYMSDLDYYVDNTGTVSGVFRSSGFLGDPNYCSVLIIVSLALLCVLYYYKRIGFAFWIMFGVIAALGLFTYSKSYFLCIASLIVILIVFVLFPKHQVWALISVIGAFVLICFVLSGKIEAINMILNRFGNGADLTTGRDELNRQYLSYIFGNIDVLIFGEGISTERFLGVGNNVHNIYIELIFKMGVTGTIIYLAALRYSFGGKLIKVDKKRRLINFVPAMFVAVMFGFLAGVLNYALPFYLIITYCAINYNTLLSRKEKI